MDTLRVALHLEDDKERFSNIIVPAATGQYYQDPAFIISSPPSTCHSDF
jgi:hypothetical protein